MPMKKNLKKSLVILCIIMTILTTILIVNSYAFYVEEAYANNTLKIARWIIKINNQEVTRGTDTSFTLTENDFIVSANSNVKDKRVAPGTNGNFLIVIDPTNTQVSVRFDISIDSTKIQNTNIKLVSVSKDDSDTNSVNIIQTDADIYSGIFSLDDIKQGKLLNLKIKFEWQNIEANNENDTELGMKKGNIINIPIIVHLIQYKGEELVKYEP